MNTSSRVRVILLDDNEGVRSILTEILKERGYEVFPYSDPGICPLQLERECLCSKGQACADIIISDVDMPSMTGLEFIENQKKKNCKIRHVVLISGGWTEERLERAHNLGCKTFSKPFPFGQFHNWLDEIEKSIEPTRELTNWFQENGSYNFSKI